jgi:hypothetical protein
MTTEIRPRSGRLKIAQHFSAGSEANNYSKAREAGDRQCNEAKFCRPLRGLNIKWTPDPSHKWLGYFQLSDSRT